MSNSIKTEWSVSDTSKELRMRSNELEFQTDDGEFQNFTIIATPDRIVFGGCCNVGFIESGYLQREDGETLDEALSELLTDLETYYNQGPDFVSRIVCNERM